MGVLMTRAFAVRLSLTAITVASIAIVLLHTLGSWSAASLPLYVQQQSNGLYVVQAFPDVPLPSPLVDGDVLAPQAMTATARAAVLYGTGVPSGSTVGVAVIRGGRILRASIPARPASAFAYDWLRRLLTAFLITPFLAALALLTLWRGRDRVAAGLCGISLYAVAAKALMALASTLVEPLAAAWLIWIVVDAQYLVAIPATYVMAEALVGAGVSLRAQRLLRIGVASLALAALILSVAWEVSFIYFGVALRAMVYQAFQALTLTAIVVIVLMLLAGSRKASHESRLRIRWVLWSTAYLIVCAAIMLMLEPVATRYPNLLEFVGTVRWFAFGGYLYAAIRTRLIDVSFVVNRALVYAGITGLLFGIFSVLELGLHDLAVGDKLSWALQAITALLLAVALSPLHRRLEHWVERIFFRKQRLAIASVRSFAAECAFIEQQSRLLETAVGRLQPHCAGVAVYERALSGYQLRAASGHAWPETIDVDDPAFVSLRAHRQEADLHGLGSAMGSDSLAFPMMVGETLSGAVICRPRTGERFAPDIRAALAEASRNLGASLYILRYREQARLVADIAAGRIDETGARRRAVAMLEGAA
jgi:hypothetical protein